MRASQERIVQGDDVTGGEVREGLEGRGNRVGHRTKMNRNMSCLRNQPSMPIKKRTGKVPPLLNVRRVTTTREHCPHLLGNGGQCASQEFQADRIDGCFLAHVLLAPSSLRRVGTLGDKVADGIDACIPTRGQHGSCVVLGHDGWPCQCYTCWESLSS